MRPDDEPEPKKPEQEPPDGRGERPTDPNELAKWIVDQTTQDSDADESSDLTGKS
jgi:hypothetical protein